MGSKSSKQEQGSHHAAGRPSTPACCNPRDTVYVVPLPTIEFTEAQFSTPVPETMTATISPSELFTPENHAKPRDLDDNQFYFYLDFPDFQFPARKTKVVIGRAPDADELLSHPLDTTAFVNADLSDGILGKRKRDSEESEQVPSDSSDEGKRVKQIKSPKDENSESTYANFEDVPNDHIRHHLTEVGGIGGPQAGSDSPDEEFVAIHAQVDGNSEWSSHSISRRHLRVVWSDDQGWTLEILGRNGCYINDEHYTRGTEVRLEDGDMVTLKGVHFQFYVPGDSDMEESNEDGDDEDSSAEGEDEVKIEADDADTSIGEGDDDEQIAQLSDEEEDDEELEEEAAEEKKAKVKISSKSKTKLPAKSLKIKLTGAKKDKDEARAPTKGLRRASSTHSKSGTADRQSSTPSLEDSQEPMTSIEAPQKRRGPGRPPADGIMSKRERRERQKAAEAGVPYGTPLPAKPKPKVKEGELEGDAVASTKKPKKTKREGADSGDGDDDAADKSKKVSDETPVPRAPTPKESDYPPEMLAKPDDTYQGLLYTLLSEHTEPMALPEIYEAMKNKWPYFRFGKESKGWESSVRHNLQSCKCFDKVQRAGKGWRWVINPEHPFERKSKRAVEPNPAAVYGSRYPPVQSLGTNPYNSYHVGYPSGSMQQISFVNGNRPPPQHPPSHGQAATAFGQQPNQHFQQPLVNGQRAPIPHPQMQPSGNYSSPYAAGNTFQNGHGQARPGSNMHMHPNTHAQTVNGQSLPATGAQYQGGQPAQRLPHTNAPQSYPHGQIPRVQAPGTVPTGPPRIVEPPADDEIRAGRTPAVVNRFLLQLRRISGADADKTMKQAEIAIDFILKRPDGNGDVDLEKDIGTPPSMVDVIRNLISKHGNDSRAYMAQGIPMAQAGHVQRGIQQPPIPVTRPPTTTPAPSIAFTPMHANGVPQQTGLIPPRPAASAPLANQSGPPPQPMSASTTITPIPAMATNPLPPTGPQAGQPQTPQAAFTPAIATSTGLTIQHPATLGSTSATTAPANTGAQAESINAVVQTPAQAQPTNLP